MFLYSLIEELCTKEENGKTGCNFNFGHECKKANFFFHIFKWRLHLRTYTCCDMYEEAFLSAVLNSGARNKIWLTRSTSQWKQNKWNCFMLSEAGRDQIVFYSPTLIVVERMKCLDITKLMHWLSQSAMHILVFNIWSRC